MREKTTCIQEEKEKSFQIMEKENVHIAQK